MKKNLYQFLLIISLLCLGASLPLKKRLKSHRKLDDFKKAELTFVKTYDLSYVDGYWKFKIQVRGDEELSNGDKLKQDIALSDGPYEFSGYSECTFNDHILDCGAGDQSGKNEYLLRISTPKSAGTIFWNYPGEQYFLVPLNHSLTFQSAYGAFFSGKWNFLVKYKNTGVTPKYSLVIIDIIQNNKETTASCQLLYKGSNEQNEEMYCISDYPYQLASDVVKLNTNKKYGSITWTNDITGDNVNIVNAAEKTGISLTLVGAYDMQYNTYNHIWSFIIEGSSPSVREVGLYKVDISTKKYSGSETTATTATCLLYDGINAEITANVKLICSCDYEEQNSRDLIKLIYPKDKGTITWSSSFTSSYSITLKTELLKATDNNYSKKTDGTYSFDLKVVDGILPLDSKVTVGIIASQTKYKATCTATSSELLSCITDDNNLPEQPRMDSVRTEGTSAKWKSYERLQLNVRYVSKYVYDTYLGRFRFNMTIANEGIPLNTLTRIPTHYGTSIASSSCILIESKKFDCTVIHEPQKSTDSFYLPETGAGEAKFIDYVYNNVKFADHLFFKKAYNLKFKDNKWKFDILLSESNLKEQQALTIDVLVDETASTASCNLNANILSCEVNAGNQNRENIIAIKNNDENNNLVWHEMAATVTLSLALEIKFKSANGLFYDNNWKFNVYYEAIGTDNYNDLTTSLDITINSEPGTAACKIQESSVLICRPSYSIHKKEDVIKIIGSKEPSLGAVSFNPALTEQIEVKPTSIEMNYKSIEKLNVNTYLYFNIIGDLPNAIAAEIEKDSYTQIQVSKNTDKTTIHDFPCTTNQIEKAKGSVVNITCQTNFLFTDEISIVRDEEGKSGYVKIIMEQEGEIDLSQTDKPTSENKENPSPSESYSSYYNIVALFYVMLFILL